MIGAGASNAQLLFPQNLRVYEMNKTLLSETQLPRIPYTGSLISEKTILLGSMWMERTPLPLVGQENPT